MYVQSLSHNFGNYIDSEFSKSPIEIEILISYISLMVQFQLEIQIFNEAKY